MLLLAALLALFANKIIADLPAYTNDDAAAHDRGDFGRVPMNSLYSVNANYNRLLQSVWEPEACERPDDYHYVLAPHGFILAHAGPLLLDQHGQQVWFRNGFATTYNLNIQTYKGDKYLTWWTGDNRMRDHGAGHYYMVHGHALVETNSGHALNNVNLSDG